MNKQKLSREEIAKIEIGHTTVTKMQIIVLSMIFLGLIIIYPIFQFVYEYQTRDIKTPLDLKPLTIFPLLSEVRMTEDSKMDKRLLDFNRGLTSAIKKYEDTLEATSALRATLFPPAQRFMIEQLKNGNEKAIVGEDGWLFYMSDFNYLINPGFLRPERLKKRVLSHVQPDPVKAIVDFYRQLQKRNIELVLLPIPVKPMLYGDKLGASVGLCQNHSWPEFQRRIAETGIKLVDVAPALAQMRANGIEPYLMTDTHWTPEGMTAVAKLLAKELGAKGDAVHKEVVQITALGDIAQMFKLTRPEEIFQMETVTLHPQKFQPDGNARILLLGDSFTNIYSLEAMNWGAHSGLAEQLMAELAEPIDVIVRNDAGAYATRLFLANELKRGRDRVAGKDVVIYEFAIRELADGDWKMLDMTLGKAQERNSQTLQKIKTVTATILAISEVPRPNSAPYKDHVMSVHLGGIDNNDEQALVYMASMRDNAWTPAAKLRIGEKVQFELSPWMEKEAEYGSWNRSELDGDELLSLEPCWGEVKK